MNYVPCETCKYKLTCLYMMKGGVGACNCQDYVEDENEDENKEVKSC